MTQSPEDILLRIERLVNAGKQQEAQPLLVEYLTANPASARAWWLMSLTLTDIKQQVDCLKRVLVLDPGNEPAYERLAKLTTLTPAPTTISPAALSPVETREPTGREPLASAGPAPASVKTDAAPSGPQKEQPAVTAEPSTPGAAAGEQKPAPARKRKSKKGLLYILLAGLFIIAAVVIYAIVLNASKQQKEQAHLNTLQETLAVAQTLASLPLPTSIPTWTASPSVTAVPSATFTSTPTFTPTIQVTSSRTPLPPSLISPEVGMYAPDFSLVELGSGQKISLSQFAGQPVLVFFWATWCSPCSQEISAIETISKTYENAGLAVLTIDAGEDFATLQFFRTQHKLTLPILLDSGSAVLTAYLVDKNNLPRHFFIDPTGKITFIGRGQMSQDELVAQVDALLHPHPTSTP